MNGDETFLGRWSRRKSESKSEDQPEESAPESPVSAREAVPDEANREAGPPPSLPAVESLTPESDFQPFMKPDVAPELRGRALRQLFLDPRYNLMDGLDVYIDDYSKPDPLPEGWLEKLNQLSHFGDVGARNEAAAKEALESGRGQPAKSEDKQGLEEESGADSLDTAEGVDLPPRVED